MGNGGTKENQNVYFRARKQAAMYNEKLSSREGAAEMLGISPSTLADYELGITKFVPVDKVVLMADLYNCPELRTGYCKYECPIGKHIPLATSVSGIEGIALRLPILITAIFPMKLPVPIFTESEISAVLSMMLIVSSPNLLTTSNCLFLGSVSPIDIK